MLPWHNPLARGSDGEAEMEALHADVMRFMAILGLCLMAVWSLLKTIEQAPDLAQLKGQAAQIDRQHEALSQANAERTQLLARIDQLNGDAERLGAALAKTQDEIARWQDQRSELDAENAQLHQAIQRLQAEQQELRRTLVDKDMDIQALHEASLAEQARSAALQQALSQARQEQARNEAVLADVTAAREQAQATAESLRQQLAEAQTAPPLAKEAEVASAPEEPGFVLRFADDAALRALLARGEVQVYALGDGQARALRMRRGRIEDRRAEAPRRYHEMQSATVPTEFRAAVSGEVDTWAVVLPARLEQRMQTEMRGARGGELVIDGRGRVSLRKRGQA